MEAASTHASAFEYYVALGPGRSYRAVAERFDVSKRAVTKHALREDWADRLLKVEAEARDKADERAVDGLHEMNDRHVRIAKALQARALEALSRMSLETARDIIRALEIGVRQERLILGEPTERQANVEEVTKREMARWLTDDDGTTAEAE